MPPGGNGFTMEMGRLGYGSWADAPLTRVVSARTMVTAMRIMAASCGWGARAKVL
jgi:hypothetical protein